MAAALVQMMEFDPRKRINVIDALKHPWLAQLHDPAAEPSAPSTFEFEFEEAEGECGPQGHGSCGPSGACA